MMKRWQVALGALVLGSLIPGTALAQSGAHYTVWDYFNNGFPTGTADAKWWYFAAGPFVGNDGNATTSSSGLRVVSKGRNAYTGQPAFTLSLAQEQLNGGLPGNFDHVKWLAYMNHVASTGQSGFDALPGHELACETWISGQTFGTRFHPFGSAVVDRDDDLRLASFAHNTIDLESFMVFDFFFTNKRVYAFYERLPVGRTPENNYAAFSYAIPVAARSTGSWHNTKIAYNRSTGVVRWILDGKEVFRVNRIGRRIDRKWMTIDHGGVEQDVSPRQLNCGMGHFSLLDGYLPSKVGLVRLSSNPNFYFVPTVGEPAPLCFVDEQSNPGSRLFGQGAEMRLLRYVVSSTPAP
jgi:hypothetical protein